MRANFSLLSELAGKIPQRSDRKATDSLSQVLLVATLESLLGGLRSRQSISRAASYKRCCQQYEVQLLANYSWHSLGYARAVQHPD